jgi:threonine aldolase
MAYCVDLRSDTVTRPTASMRRAMADADVGDDWYGDDPTVNRLQDRAAEEVGKEAAIYVPTGTMANQIGLRLHVAGNGHLVLCERRSHVATTEMMTSAVLSGISFRTLESGRRGLTAGDVAGGLDRDAYFDVEVVDCVSLENTMGGYGGTVAPVEEFRAIRKVAESAGVPVHLDGARLFNAAAAAGVAASEFAAEADTVMFCVSKGLGAPIGSLLCGPAEAMPEARRLKILFGGAWRQAGVMAAAGLIALAEGRERLHEDHARARRLAEGLAELVGGAMDPSAVETNMVFVDVHSLGRDALEMLDRLGEEGVGVTPIGPGTLRMVTHHDVDDAGIEAALAGWRRVLAAD